MKNFPAWIEGAIFGILFVPLMFILKIICPVDTGCFADPFLILIFSPLLLVETLFGRSQIPYEGELIVILIFWSIVSALAAHLYSNIARSYKQQFNKYYDEENEELEV